jgi:hypothetical protein
MLHVLSIFFGLIAVSYGFESTYWFERTARVELFSHFYSHSVMNVTNYLSREEVLLD